ncbi:TetR/AcrR family transcriptional regulator [Bradyrhizobium japonicum]|jgi:AcrR family transcriptional regulator|uniref:TetR/AcrR family transcriptional regulator n=1 Tax=Bradyrhizobium japonicum TaxID=375 RepID=UPI001BA74361|nr:TetR-like C-terminal domain-containing protein [Bradyrhizobium japonicum]MBR0993448.1 TetR/AcrR family transcriptional regulator [Bradyrhizobium japonicum]
MAKIDTKSETARRTRPPRTSSTAASRPKRGAASVKSETPYHHGALREALLEAAERVLERDGLAGLTLRAVAREAGVSHAAPTHHFGDLTGLLSELAAVGFRQFNAAMASSCDAATTPLEAALARPKAYVAYAQAHPGMYGIMFRTERLDYSRPSLHEAAEASFAGLANAIGMMRQERISGDALTLNQGAAIARAWSMVHGFTTLLLDGRLEDILGRLPEGTTAERLLEAMLTVPMAGKPPGP